MRPVSNFYDRIAEAASRFPDRPAIERIGAAGVETTTYRALLDEAGRVAAWLGVVGVGAGDRVAILGDNSARWIAVYLGILRHGAVAVPLDTAYKPAQVQTILADSGALVLFADRGSYRFSTDPASPVPGLGAVLVPRPGTESPGSVENRYDPAVILYTSGTTADPKGVVLSHDNLDAERIGALGIVRADEHDVILGVLPLFHALAQMANLLLPLSIGARVVFLETVSSTSLLAALDSRGVTIFACVPQFFYLIHQRVLAEVSRGGRLSRAAFRLLVSANVWLRDHIGWNPGPPRVRARPSHPRSVDAGAHHRWLACRPRDRPRPLRHGLHPAQRVWPDRDVRRRDDHAARRPLHDVGRTALRGRPDPHRPAGRRRPRPMTTRTTTARC